MRTLLGELWVFLGARNKRWMAPLVVLLVAMGGALVLAEGSAVAPFLYTLF
jgi:hypothetical protein